MTFSQIRWGGRRRSTAPPSAMTPGPTALTSPLKVTCLSLTSTL
jgi:hypothetical protein